MLKQVQHDEVGMKVLVKCERPAAGVPLPAFVVPAHRSGERGGEHRAADAERGDQQGDLIERVAHDRFLLGWLGRIDPPDWATILPLLNISECQHFSIVIRSMMVAFSATGGRSPRRVCAFLQGRDCDRVHPMNRFSTRSPASGQSQATISGSIWKVTLCFSQLRGILRRSARKSHRFDSRPAVQTAGPAR